MRQWQCPCGTWVDMSHLRHIHQVSGREPTLQEMVAARKAGRDAEATAAVSEISEVHWKPEYPRRDKPDE
jgi:hypothetical protein